MERRWDRKACVRCRIRRILRGGMILAAGLCLMAAGGGLLFRDFYGESIDAAAKAVAVNVVAIKINQSLEEGITNGGLQGELLHVEQDSEGKVQYVEADSRLITQLVLAFSMKMNENYNTGDTEVVPMNLGILTGNKLLSQLPLTVNVKVMPLSLTKFQCETEFETQAINQTRYKVYCTVTSNVQIVAPFSRETAEISRKVLLAEAVIIGDVPENYVRVPQDDILDVT
ncbi:MAG: sporulation protein YunB [Firmicutes bacterium]|nr:sporulation protein YunB [Bacillota bacterium]MDD7601067.1 sporulation protein YunB [Bacillota bacterium]MDY5856501.1 sporulation protein YunB [Anaerovoracaceae bacterium]